MILEDTRIHRVLLALSITLLAISVFTTIYSIKIMFPPSNDLMEQRAQIIDGFSLLSLSFSLVILVIGVTSIVYSYVELGLLQSAILLIASYMSLIVVVSLRNHATQLLLEYAPVISNYTIFSIGTHKIILFVSMIASFTGVLLATYGFLKMVEDVGGG